MTKDGKDQQWREAAHKALETLARSNSMIVSDMVVTALEEQGLGLDNYSALGGVFMRAAKDNLIIKTDDKQHSTLKKSHSAKTVWRSLVYQKPNQNTEQTTLNNLLMAALDFNAFTVRYASMIYAGPQLTQKTHKQAVKDFAAMQDNYSARISMIVEDFERHSKVGGKKA